MENSERNDDPRRLIRKHSIIQRRIFKIWNYKKKSNEKPELKIWSDFSVKKHGAIFNGNSWRLRGAPYSFWYVLFQIVRFLWHEKNWLGITDGQDGDFTSDSMKLLWMILFESSAAALRNLWSKMGSEDISRSEQISSFDSIMWIRMFELISRIGMDKCILHMKSPWHISSSWIPKMENFLDQITHYHIIK
jgi:hypothetical protein